MNCARAENLIAARLDGEPVAGPALDAHLAECAACRERAARDELQDAALVRAFAPRRAAAAALAGEAMRELSVEGAPAVAPHASVRRGRFGRLAGWATAAAAGFLVAILPVGPSERRADVRPAPTPPTPPQAVAHLTLSTGAVFSCPPSQEDWRQIAPGGTLAAGDRVRTSDLSRCELRLADGSQMRLNVGTEACFTEGRGVQMTGGQLWSSLPAGAPPLRVTAGRTSVTACAPPQERGTQFNVASETGAAVVTVLHGTAEVSGDVMPTIIRSGEFLRVAPNSFSAAEPFAAVCVPTANPRQATVWQDELLILKPPDDPELTDRVAQLAAEIAAERSRAASGVPGPIEDGLRGRGYAWTAPLAAFLRRGSGDADARRAAASLLADLASADRVPDLVALLADADGEVRRKAANALWRLTGHPVEHSPERFERYR